VAGVGHRKIHALLELDDHHASQATVRRAPGRRGLLQPAGYQRERRALAKARKEAFVAPVTRRNRIWQTDFSGFETAGGGNWQLGGVVDYWAKLSLACPVTTTKTWREAIAAIEDARDAVTDLLGRSLLEDCTDAETGEITPLIVVTDNDPCYRAAAFARHIASRPELAHVRTCHRSPENNGVIERFYESIKYEHLYRHEIDDGLVLTDHVTRYREDYNRRRPHEALDFSFPITRYTTDPNPAKHPTPNAPDCLNHLTRDTPRNPPRDTLERLVMMGFESPVDFLGICR
jgi:putative transposase